MATGTGARYCRACGGPVQPGQIKCSSCGASLLACSFCGKPIKAKAKKCQFCGKSVLPQERPAHSPTTDTGRGSEEAVTAEKHQALPAAAEAISQAEELAAAEILLAGGESNADERLTTSPAMRHGFSERQSGREEGRLPPPLSMGHSEWQTKIRLGLGFHYVRTVVIVLWFFCAIVLGCLGELSFRLRGASVWGSAAERTLKGMLPGEGILLFSLCTDLIGVCVILILGVVGSFLCLSIPRQQGGRALMIVSCSLDLLFWVLPLFLQLGLFGLFRDFYFQLLLGVLVLGRFLIGPLSWVFFILFLKRLAVSLQEPTLRDEAGSILRYGVPLLVALLALYVALNLFGIWIRIYIDPRLGPLAGLLITTTLFPLVAIILVLPLLYMQLRLLGKLRQALRTGSEV